MDESHSPDSFYEKLIEDISAESSNEHIVRVKVEKTETKVPFKLEVDEEETDSSSDEDDTPTPNFYENAWGDNFPEEPTGINFKAKTSIFKNAIEKVKIIFRK